MSDKKLGRPLNYSLLSTIFISLLDFIIRTRSIRICIYVSITNSSIGKMYLWHVYNTQAFDVRWYESRMP